MNVSRSWNSLADRFTSLSPRHTRRDAGSSFSVPTSSTGGGSTGPRRASARPGARRAAEEKGSAGGAGGRAREAPGEGERLGGVVAGPAAEPAHPVLDRAARGEHDHRRPDPV